jgi:hypothetical protein
MRIRRFNESSEGEIDVEYIRQCFIDFVDAGQAKIDLGGSAAYGKWVDVAINFPKIPTKLGEWNDDTLRSRKLGSEWVRNENNLVAKTAENMEKQAGYLREVESCLRRLADEYPDYSFKAFSNGFYGGMTATQLIIKIWA